jgi:hypothetical protein
MWSTLRSTTITDVIPLLLSVSDGAERVCVDPGEAILGAGGPGPPGGGKGGQLASDSRGG